MELAGSPGRQYDRKASMPASELPVLRRGKIPGYAETASPRILTS